MHSNSIHYRHDELAMNTRVIAPLLVTHSSKCNSFLVMLSSSFLFEISPKCLDETTTAPHCYLPLRRTARSGNSLRRIVDHTWPWGDFDKVMSNMKTALTKMFRCILNRIFSLMLISLINLLPFHLVYRRTVTSPASFSSAKILRNIRVFYVRTMRNSV